MNTYLDNYETDMEYMTDDDDALDMSQVSIFDEILNKEIELEEQQQEEDALRTVAQEAQEQRKLKGFEYKLLKLSVENLGELKEWHKKLKDMTKQLGQQIKAMEPKVEK